MAADTTTPLVSVILTTRDRPRFLSLALECYRLQTYLHSELIVVDDGDRCPADESVIRAVGGQLIRVAPGTPLGTKLNVGIEQATGVWCQKMDDDDWYAPDFLARMIGAVIDHRKTVCRPLLAFLSPFLFFDLARWEIKRSTANNLPGATLLCAREDWRYRPFRPLRQDEDLWFLRDQISVGSAAFPIHSLESYLAVRHKGESLDRGHTWVHQLDGRTLEQHLDDRPVHRTPEELLPSWAIERYRQLRPQTISPS